MKKSLLKGLFIFAVGSAIASVIYFSDSSKDNNPPKRQEKLSWDIISSEVIEILSWDIINSWDNQALSWAITRDIDNPLLYTNTEFWFQVTLPKWWEEYKAFTYDIEGNPWYGSGLIVKIIITLPTNESNRPGVEDPNNTNSMKSWYTTWTIQYIKWYADMFGITIRSTQYYDNYKCEVNEPCLKEGELLWKNERFTYQLIWPHDFPTDIYKLWWNRKYFKQIIPTFKVL